MICWCAYCQNYIGQKHPFNNLAMTHGLCTACKSAGAHKGEIRTDKIKAIQRFFLELRKAVSEANLPDSQYIIDKSGTLGLKPTDLMMGVLQPILFDIGIRYAKGEVTVTQEHRFSQLADALITKLSPEPQMRADTLIDVLLVCCDTNYHSLGVRVMTAELREIGYKVFSVVPSLPNAEVVEIAKRMSPTVIGISVGLPEQVTQTKSLISELRSSLQGTEAPSIAVGGNGVREIEAATALKADFVDQPENKREFLSFVAQITGNITKAS